jgi:phage gp29-like protein
MAKTNSKIGKATPARVLPWKLKSVSRSRQDIQSWNRALNMAQFAEEPRLWPLQLLYNEIRTDALLTALIENRFQQLASSNARLLKPDGEVDEESTAIMRNLKAYSKINRSIFESNIHGNSVVELSLFPDKQVDLVQIPYTNIVPQKGLFYSDYTDDTKAIPYRELKEFGTWILEFNSGTLGLLNKAVPHVLYKRFAQSCHSELCEIYGIPPRVLKTNTQDGTMLSRGEQMMKDMGAAAYFIIDETETLEFAQGVGTNGDVYTNLQNFCNSEISMLFNGAVIGQDTKNGNRSKDEAGQEMLWLLVQSDMRIIEQYWNHTVLPALVNIGVLPAGLRFEYEEAEDTKQLFEFTKGFMDKYKIPTDWIMEKFGVPVEEIEREEPDPEPDPAKKKKGEKLSAQLPASFFD